MTTKEKTATYIPSMPTSKIALEQEKSDNTMYLIRDICTSKESFKKGKQQLSLDSKKRVIGEVTRLLVPNTLVSHPRFATKNINLPKACKINSGNRGYSDLMSIQRTINEYLIMQLSMEIIEKIIQLSKNQIIDFAISRNKSNLYLWIVVKDGEFEVSDKIDSLVNKYNEKHKPDSIAVFCTINELFMSIDVPNNYIKIPVDISFV